MLAYVNFTRVNEIEAMYGRSRVNAKVEPRSTFTFITRGLSYRSYITSILFTRVRTSKLRDILRLLFERGSMSYDLAICTIKLTKLEALHRKEKMPFFNSINGHLKTVP